MRTFLVDKDKKPIIQWSLLPLNTYFEGVIPEGYKLALNPSDNIIIVDVDVDKEKSKDGFKNIPPIDIHHQLFNTFHYFTKRGGAHFYLKYTGNKTLLNKASNQNIDLRVGPTLDNNGKIINNGGYAIFYPASINPLEDIRNHLHEIKETSEEMNKWLEKLFI